MHHGLANAIMIDYVMRFNLPAAPAKMKELARVCGAGDEAEAFAPWLERLKDRIGIPQRLGAVGIAPNQIEALAKLALADSCHRTNPRPCSGGDFAALFAAAI